MELYEKFLTEQIDDLGHLVGVQFHAPNDFNFGFDVVDFYGKFEPNRRAMIWVADDGQDRVFTFADIMKLSNQTANYFKSLGIVKGDRVMLVLRRHWEFWPVIIALHKLGAIAIP
ncbi:MAG: AMP-binding protein, partial [Clostridia bacterium]